METVHCLLQLGADPNLLDSDGRPALYGALQAGDVDCVEMLIGVTNKGDHHSFLSPRGASITAQVDLSVRPSIRQEQNPLSLSRLLLGYSKAL